MSFTIAYVKLSLFQLFFGFSESSIWQCSAVFINMFFLGVAVEDDIYKEARQQIEQELAHREAVETASRLLDEILEGVRTPERPRSPVDAYITVSGVIQVTGDSGGVKTRLWGFYTVEVKWTVPFYWLRETWACFNRSLNADYMLQRPFCVKDSFFSWVCEIR